MISLGSSTWGSSPTIGVSFAYEKQRSGANMQYRAKVTINAVTGASYFGYPIYLELKMDGSTKTTQTLKSASPSQWSSAITYTSSWYTISNKVSGSTSVAFRIYSGSGSSRNTTYTYTMAVDPAGSSISASNGTLGSAQTLTITRYSSSFTDTIRYTCGGASGTIASGSQATSISWTPPLSLASQNTTGTSVSITLSCSTYQGANLVQTQSTTITCAIPATVKPSVSVAISDSTGYASTYGNYVQGKSRLAITVTPTLAYSSPINAYTVTADGNTYAASSVTTPVLQLTGARSVTAKATDKRGRTSTTVSQSYTVLSYSQPYCPTFSAVRCDQDGTVNAEGHYMAINFTGRVTALNNVNSAAYVIRYKVTSANTWTTVTCTEINNVYTATATQRIIAAADASSYDVQVRITDDFGTVIAASTQVPVAFTIMNWRTNGDGMAIGGINTQTGLQIYMDEDAYGNNTLKGASVNDVILECKNRYQNTARTKTQSDVTFTVNSDGSVKVNGTASALTDFYISDAVPIPDGTYKLNGITGGSNSTIRLYASVNTNGTISYVGINDGDGTFTASSSTVRLFIRVYSGATITNKMIYPMVRLASVTDSDYVPYAMTNLELTRRGIVVDRLYTLSAIPTSYTAYSCDWQNYDFLLFSALTYGNVEESTIVTVSYFAATDSGRRPIIYDSRHQVTYQLYQNGNGSVKVRSDNNAAQYGLWIDGIKLG